MIVNQTELAFNGSCTYSGPNILYLAGVNTTFSNGLTSNGTITNNGSTILTDNLNLNSSDTTKNRIIQTIVTSGDVSGNHNNLKYSIIRYNSNSATGTTQPALTLLDSFNNNNLIFLPNSGPGAYNSSVSINSRAIIASGTQHSNTLCLSGWGSTRLGLRLQHVNSTSANATLEAGTNRITLNNSTGIDVLGVNQIRFGSAGTVINSDYGTIYQANLTSTVTLTSGVESDCTVTALTLPAGIYSISWIVTFHTLVGTTTIGTYAGGYTESTSTFTDFITRGSFLNQTAPIDTYFSTSGNTIRQYTSPTNIYLRCACNFGTINRVEFLGGISSLRAVKIA
jgi:hypothetical protein